MTRDDDGVIEETLHLEAAGRRVPAVLWRPEKADEQTPLVLAGHGGGFGTAGHKRVQGIVDLARRLAVERGIATVAIDQPGCGERDGAEQEQARRRQMTVEEAITSLWTKELVEEMTADWQFTIDYLVANRGLGHAGVGYWGLSGGTTFGLPLVASEPRITAAVLGLNGDVPLMRAYAGDVVCPVLFMMNLDDHFMTRDSCLALFDALTSTDKRLLGMPGDHGVNMDRAVPDWVTFFGDRLG